MQTNLAVPLEAEDIETKALSIPDQAKAVEIRGDEDFARAGDLLLSIKDIRKEIDATFDPIIRKQYEAHREAVAQKRRIEAPLVEAEGIIKPRMAFYQTEQEKRRKEEEERLRQEAIKRAEEERLNDAITAESSGMADLADSILDGPTYIPTIVVPKSAPRPAGISFSEKWSAEVVDLMSLVRAVASGKAPLNTIEANMTVLNSLARSLKSQLNYPGVRTVVEKVVAAGRR